MVKQYRILKKIYGEGTKYQDTMYYPQVMNPHTLNDKIEPWEFFTKDTDQPIYFLLMETASDYIEKQKAMDIPVRTIIHPVN